jgi:hypothetical protein
VGEEVAGLYTNLPSNGDRPMMRSKVLSGWGTWARRSCWAAACRGYLWAFAVRGEPWRTANTLVCRAPYPMMHGKEYF